MSGQESRRGAPSNSELAERTARIEANVEHVAETVDRIDDKLDAEMADVQDDVDDIKPEHKRLWLTYQAAKWGAGIASGGGVIALLVTAFI